MYSRSTVRCEMGHTELHPGKTEARAHWMRFLRPSGNVLLLSHGALDEFSFMNLFGHYNGEITVADHDPGVIQSARFMREGNPATGKPSDYPNLRLQPELLGDIRDVTAQLLQARGPRYLNGGAIDLDGTETIKKFWPIVSDILSQLLAQRATQNVLVPVTYRNGRDGMGKNAAHHRFAWIQARLPRGVIMLPQGQLYRSDYIGRHATRERGSSMALVVLKVR